MARPRSFRNRSPPRAPVAKPGLLWVDRFCKGFRVQGLGVSGLDLFDPCGAEFGVQGCCMGFGSLCGFDRFFTAGFRASAYRTLGLVARRIEGLGSRSSAKIWNSIPCHPITSSTVQGLVAAAKVLLPVLLLPHWCRWFGCADATTGTVHNCFDCSSASLPILRRQLLLLRRLLLLSTHII